ncbi:phage major tail tube protein [Pseudomonas sp. BCRC 81390]|uniref:phage major tail tube protein n=1 Tax=Pseudomonas sp. BCRC 81390 TaxID=3054778 RepID=UPI0025961ABA|nr:phage major tail tube protein [Pseudomonas sp. BCRC 81390]MDM3884689.1 phage major tail tube protein [Pseudomonas sp. BCRC 81390]
MFTNRTRQLIAATLQGLPLHLTIESFQAPDVELDMEEHKGGRFIAEEMAKGGKVLNAKLILQGIGAPVLMALGSVRDINLNVRESGKDQDDNPWWTYHTVQGKFKSLKETTLEMGKKPVTELEISCRTYTRLENGILVADIDARTQKFMLNGEDILADARRLVLLP